MDYIRIKNWEDLQHYKDRSPPWIKLYNSLLDDFQFSCLPDVSKGHLLAIMMLASRTNNKIPDNKKWISAKISATDDLDLNLLVDSGFVEKIPSENNDVATRYQDASKALQDSEQSACPEESRGEEKREEKMGGREESQAKPSRCGIQFECKDGKWTCPDDFLSECARRYGEKNVLNEFGNAAFWLISNPAKRKGKRGMTRFLGSWLQRKAEQDPGFRPPADPVKQESQFATELTEEHKAKNEEMRGRLADMLKGFEG